MIFGKKDSMATALIENPNLLYINDRFNISLGIKEASIEDVCKWHEVNIDFYLAIINTYNNASYFDSSHLQYFSPILIVDYLRKTHKYYLSEALPKLRKSLELFISSYRGDDANINLIDSFYKEYEKELLTHIQDEEENIFPYIERLVNNELLDCDNSIHTFEEEHSNVDIKLNDLKNLIIKYISPVYNINFCNDFLILVDRFEKDIINHARIEDNILVPQAIVLEKERVS
jgi:regulator of cell morphogenesis and NO signaling